MLLKFCDRRLLLYHRSQIFIDDLISSSCYFPDTWCDPALSHFHLGNNPCIGFKCESHIHYWFLLYDHNLMPEITPSWSVTPKHFPSNGCNLFATRSDNSCIFHCVCKFYLSLHLFHSSTRQDHCWLTTITIYAILNY